MKMKIFSFLPKSATVTFQQNPAPFSPGRENNNNKHKSHHVNKGFSGQLIPDEARRKSSSGRSFGEPTSPKVSCMGQIKLKKKVCNSSSKSPSKEEEDQKKNKKKIKKSKENKPVSKTSPEVVVVPAATASSKVSREENNKKFDSLPSLTKTRAAAPSLDQMKRFASGRDSLANFDWRDFHDDGGEEEEEDEVFIAHSAPLMMGGGGRIAMEPKKEINLWKRRTTAPPKPLQIHVSNNKLDK